MPRATPRAARRKRGAEEDEAASYDHEGADAEDPVVLAEGLADEDGDDASPDEADDDTDAPTDAAATAARASPQADASDVQRYLSEIGRVPLLTRHEEVDLARRIEAGAGAAEELEALPIPPDDEDEATQRRRRELRRRIEDGEAAKEAFVEANLRLVVSVAKKYRNRGLGFLDLIQEGNQGLLRAVEKYDVNTGFKFSTYAVWWIRQAVVRALANAGRTIRLPVHFQETLSHIAGASEKLRQELGRPPSREEIASAMGDGWDVQRVDETLRLSREPISLERPVGEEEETAFGDLVADEEATSPLEAASDEALSEKLDELLERLPDREAAVLRLRFGLAGGREHTLEEIGRMYGVTREAIRQVESKGLRKMHYLAKRSKTLTDFLD